MIRSLATFLVAATVVASGLGNAQSPPGNSPDWPSFEVASIKPSTSAGEMPSYLPPAVRLPNTTLDRHIRLAYQHPDPYEIRGGPPWIYRDRFDIVAKYPEGATMEQLPLLLRSLMRDRFNLQVHTESKDDQVYNLVIARADGRLGPRLRTARADCPPAQERGNAPCTGTGETKQTASDGTVIRTRHYRSVPLDWLLIELRNRVQRPVLDRTNLTGDVDFDLTYDTQPLTSSAAPSGAPSLFDALERQLGLKLVSARGRVPVLVIDRVEHPTPN